MHNSHFDREALLAKARELETDDAPAPGWLAKALRLLADNADLLPPQDDPERFVIEYIYPH